MSCPLSFTIPGEDALKLKKRIQAEALMRGFSMSEFIVEAIVEYLRNHG